jgi:hypothetical protein
MTEIRHENGNWNVYVNGDPKFSFIYRDEADLVIQMIDGLIMVHGELQDPELPMLSIETMDAVFNTLKKIGAL